MAGAAGPVTGWEAAPPSDQAAKMYWTPGVPAWVGAARVWVEPGIHCSAQGETQVAPSARSDSPAGELTRLTATGRRVKAAVTEAGAFSVRFCGVTLPVSAPEKPENW